MITVNESLCTGCSVCVEVCPPGAIRLEQAIAVIDQAECTQCEACLEVCPEGAIFGVREPLGEGVRLPVERPTPEPIQVQVDQVAAASTPQRTGILPMVAGALAHVGRELPRILPAVLDALERRSLQTGGSSRRPRTQAASRNGRGKRHRHRRRGG
jgi:Fe-S-cluster-containing hydrogenase component 2